MVEVTIVTFAIKTRKAHIFIKYTHIHLGDHLTLGKTSGAHLLNTLGQNLFESLSHPQMH